MTATASLLKDLEDPAKFAVEPEAVVFDEHERWIKDEAGNMTLRKVTKSDLERYAANGLQRDSEGSPCAMTIGHTIDGAPETEQPPIVGYWRKFRVGFSKEMKRHVLYATPYIMKEHEAEAKKYPRASVEAFPTRGVIDPIAIQVRTPDRPIQWTHSLAGTVQRFKMTAGEKPYRYMAPSMDMQSGMQGGDPTGKPDAGAPSPEEVERHKMCAHVAFPKLQEMHDHYANKGRIDTSGTTEHAAPPMGDKNLHSMTEAEKHDMATVAELERKMSQLEASDKAKGETIASLERLLREQTRSTELEKFAAIIEEGERDELMSEPVEKYTLHKTRLEKRLAAFQSADPTKYTMLNTTGKAPSSRTDGPMGADVYKKANDYMAKNHEKLQKFSVEERWEKAKRYAMTGKDE